MKDDEQLLPLDQLELKPEVLRAVVAIRTRKIPPEMISEHPGKGGKKFRYLKHTNATDIMLDSGLPWDYEVLSYQVFPDKSVSALCKLTVRLQLKDGTWVSRTITEVGVHDGNVQPPLPTASAVAAAASRGLPRCIFRMFGLGKELYPDSVTPTAGWWSALNGYARNLKVAEADLIEALKKAGITKDDLEERYEEAIEIARGLKK